MSVCSQVVQGLGVGEFLHKCSRLKGLKGVGFCTLGSPTRLRDGGSSSESFLVGGRKSPRLCAIMAFLRSCVQRWSKGLWVVKLVLRLSRLSRGKSGQSVVRFISLALGSL